MTRYKVVEAESAERLARLVQALVDTGWQCQGGVAVTYNQPSNLYTYAQAMVVR